MLRGVAPPYIHRMSVRHALPVTEHWVGCVTRVESGVYELLCGGGRFPVTLGGPMLAEMARDPLAAPCPGDWCVVRTWPDGPRTLERVLTGHRVAPESCRGPHPVS